MVPMLPSFALHAAARAVHAAFSGAPPPSFIPSVVPPAAAHSSGVASMHRSAHVRLESASPFALMTPMDTYVSSLASRTAFALSGAAPAAFFIGSWFAWSHESRPSYTHVS